MSERLLNLLALSVGLGAVLSVLLLLVVFGLLSYTMVFPFDEGLLEVALFAVLTPVLALAIFRALRRLG